MLLECDYDKKNLVKKDGNAINECIIFGIIYLPHIIKCQCINRIISLCFL